LITVVALGRENKGRSFVREHAHEVERSP